GGVLREVVPVERQLGEADELRAPGRRVVDEVKVPFEVGLHIRPVYRRVRRVRVPALDVHQGHGQVARIGPFRNGRRRLPAGRLPRGKREGDQTGTDGDDDGAEGLHSEGQ